MTIAFTLVAGLRAINTSLVLLLAAFVMTMPLTSPATAQDSATTADGSTGEAKPEARKPDPYGRETPRGVASGLLASLGAQDFERASQFLDLSPMKPEYRISQGSQIAARLQHVLDRGGSLVPFPSLSNDPAGVLDDGLPENQERIGAFKTPTGDIPLIAMRIEAPGTTPYWAVSFDSLRAMPREKAAVKETVVAKVLPDAVAKSRVAGAPVSDWLTLLAIGAICYGVSWGVFRLFMMALNRVVRRPEENQGVQFASAAFPPLAMYIGVIAFFAVTQRMEVAIVARQLLARLATIVAWVALVWFLWRLIDTLAALWSRRMSRVDHRRAISLGNFVRRSAKLLLGVVAFVAVLDTLGVDVTTGIAALGIGGLALALGAQKTIENVVGSLTVIVDQPARIGDFCKVGDVAGTIEDIGMRSTRIRTNARTVVTIPNGAFSSLQIENFSKRDRFLFNPVIGLTYDTSADQMRGVLTAIREVLAADENIIDTGARARLIKFNASSLDIEVFAYFNTYDFATSLEMQEEAMLNIMVAIEKAGASIAFPTQTLLLRP